MKSALKEHFEKLGERDRKALRILKLFLPVLLYLLVMKPAYDFYRDAREQFDKNRELLLWMQLHSTEVSSPRSAEKTSTRETDLIRVVSVTADRYEIGFDRIQPLDEQRIRISATKLSFAALSRFLTALEENHLIIEEIRIEALASMGEVSFHGTVSR